MSRKGRNSHRSDWRQKRRKAATVTAEVPDDIAMRDLLAARNFAIEVGSLAKAKRALQVLEQFRDELLPL